MTETLGYIECKERAESHEEHSGVPHEVSTTALSTAEGRTSEDVTLTGSQQSFSCDLGAGVRVRDRARVRVRG